MDTRILLSELGIQKFHIVAGKKAWSAVHPYLPDEIVKRASANFTFMKDIVLYIPLKILLINYL